MSYSIIVNINNTQTTIESDLSLTTANYLLEGYRKMFAEYVESSHNAVMLSTSPMKTIFSRMIFNSCTREAFSIRQDFVEEKVEYVKAFSEKEFSDLIAMYC